MCSVTSGNDVTRHVAGHVSQSAIFGGAEGCICLMVYRHSAPTNISLQPLGTPCSSVEGVKPVIASSGASISGSSCIMMRRDAWQAILVVNHGQCGAVGSVDRLQCQKRSAVLSQVMHVCRYVACSSCRSPISLLRCSPKPLDGCCRTPSYTCVYVL